MFELRYYQKDAVAAFDAFVRTCPELNPLIVVPTAGGKSAVIAFITKKVIDYPGTRVLILAHQKELIVQNSNELLNIFNSELVDVGINSAGLKSRDTDHRVIFAGIQSVHKKAWHLGSFDLVIVDEVHRVAVNAEGTYRSFLKDVKTINPKCVIVGLTATAFRMKGGLICDESNKERIFHKICYEAKIPELIDANHPNNRDKKQYLCTLISKNSVNCADMTGVHKTAGEYNLKEMEVAFDKNDLISRTVREIKELAFDRKKILVFTAGVKHAQNVYEKLLEVGFSAGIIHSKKSQKENDFEIQKFKNGEIKVLVNIEILTTGFNERAIDCIAMIRSTASAGLYCQIVGRGFRIHPSKENCLFLDFGNNILTHGPIDKIEIRQKKGGGSEIGTAPMKECPKCHAAIFAGSMECPECGYLYPEPEPKHDSIASDEDILSKWKKPETYNVVKVEYSAHEKEGKTPSLRVDYHLNAYNTKYSEWICLEHSGYAQDKAFKWVKARLQDGITVSGIPTINQVIDNKKLLKEPKQIIVDLNERFPRITGYIF